MGEHGPLNTYAGFHIMTALLFSFTLITNKKFAVELLCIQWSTYAVWTAFSSENNHYHILQSSEHTK